MKKIMMKKIVLIAVTSLTAMAVSAQDFPGYRTGNYTGVNGVFFNPANIADSRYYLDVNLLSASALAANDQASFKLKNLSGTFNGDSIRNRLFGKDPGPASGMLNVDIHGPSAMMGVGTKGAVAITTRARMFSNVQNVDGKLFSQLATQDPDDPALPYRLTSDQHMQFSMNAWKEFGASYSRVFVNTGAHVLKGGITLKYLAGTANGYLNIERFNGSITSSHLLHRVYLEDATGRVTTGFGGMRVAGFEAKDLFKMKSSGLGTDLGVVYEFRPDGEMQTVDGIKLDNDYQNTYRFRFGLALLDLGSITYKKDVERTGAYEMNVPLGQPIRVDELSRVDVDDYKAYFEDHPQFFTPLPGDSDAEYIVSLPTTLQLDADLLIYDGWYVSLASQISLSNNNKKLFNNRTYTSLTLTPRYESSLLGFYLPLNYNQLTKLNAGFSIRIGPLFLGSGSLLTALMGNSKQADFHFGLRLGELK